MSYYDNVLSQPEIKNYMTQLHEVCNSMKAKHKAGEDHTIESKEGQTIIFNLRMMGIDLPTLRKIYTSLYPEG